MAAVENAEDEDELPKDLGKVSSGYRRALWIVAALNVGYACIEAVASFAARSEALKADALDFLGDGVITGLGLVALRWNDAARARAAVTQGVFLAVLGLGVFGTVAYRVFIRHEPAAETMGVFGGIALLVNVAAALVLLPHRKGDSNVRAVWLFSRNDALGNLAVLAAAALVAWTGTRWPDLASGAIIAALFLHSAWSIVGDARRDLDKACGVKKEHHR